MAASTSLTGIRQKNYGSLKEVEMFCSPFPKTVIH